MLHLCQTTAATIETLFKDLSDLIPATRISTCTTEYQPLLFVIQLLSLLVGTYSTICMLSNQKTKGFFFGSLFYSIMIACSILITFTESPEYRNLLRIVTIVLHGTSALSYWYTRLIVPKRMFMFTFMLLLGYNLKYYYLSKPIYLLQEATVVLPTLLSIFAVGRRLSELGTSSWWKYFTVTGFLVLMIGLGVDDELCNLDLSLVHFVYLGWSVMVLGITQLQLSMRLPSKDKKE